MPKLNQIVAILQGKKSQTDKVKTEIYKDIQKPTLFEGMTRTYTKKNDEGDNYPSESKIVQKTVLQSLDCFLNTVKELIDTTATQDFANCSAKSDIVVDDVIILENVPVTHLMFLEKQLTDIQTFISHLPTLDPSKRWNWDRNSLSYVSDPVKTVKTKKVPRNHVKADATKEHPAQVEVYMEDIQVGEWTTTEMSGAIPLEDKELFLQRVRKLIDAVKFARENANQLEVKIVNQSSRLIDFLFKKKEL